MNIYQLMKMQSLSPQQVAAAAFGARAPTAPSVVKTDVQSLFNRGAKVRGLINASSDMNYVLGQAGAGLNGFGQFAGSTYAIMPGVGFEEVWAHEEWRSCCGNTKWLDHIRYWKIADYTPLPAFTLKAAKDKWTTLQSLAEAGVEQAGAMIESYTQQLTSLAKAADGLVKQCSELGVCSNATHADKADNYKRINALIRTIAGAKVPSADIGTSGAGSGSTTSPGAYSNQELLTKLAAGRLKREREQELLTGQNAATAAGGMPKWALPAVVGVVAIGVTLFFLKRKG